ncbi:MAG: PAS domain S-box protein [Chloroflexi bacterium]|nr:PAS domain S-box protein [Chloroflexota bacterium]
MKKESSQSTIEAKEIQHHLARLTALHKTMLEIAAQHELTNLLQTTIRCATELLGATSGGLYLCEPGMQECSCVVSYKMSRNFIDTRRKYGDGATGKVAASGQPLMIDDYRTWEGRAAEFEQEEPFRALLVTPLLWKGQVTGVIDIMRELPFTQDDLELLVLFSSQAAIAVENVRLLEAAKVEIAERKRTELLLRESEERFQNLARISPVGIFRTDSDGSTTYVNPKWCAISGLSVEKALGDGWLDAVHPGDKEYIRKGWRESAQRHKTSFSEYRFVRPDGTVAWVMGQAVPETNSENQVVGYVGTITDITERKHTEEALRTSEEKFSKAFRSSPDSVTISSLIEGTLMEVNDGFEKLFGYSREEALGRPTLELNLYNDPEDRRRFVQLLQKNGRVQSLELMGRRKSGEKLIAQLSAEVMGIGDQQYLITIVRDITERRRAEDEVRQRAGELTALLKSSQELTTTLELGTVLQTTADSVTELMELERAAIYLLEGETLYLGATSPDLPPQVPEEFRFAPLTGHPHIREAITTGLPVFLPDAAAADLTPAERALSDVQGLRSILYLPLLAGAKVVGTLIVASVGEPRLISEGKIEVCRTLANLAALAVENARLYESIQRHAAELEQHVAERTTELQNANKELETFAYTVSHDLKAPLRGLDGYSRLLLEDHADKLNEEGHQFLFNIRQAAVQMNDLIEDLLQYSRLERRAVTFGTVNLRALIEAILAERADDIESRGVKVTVKIPLESINADPEGLSMALRNLLDNALKFTDVSQYPLSGDQNHQARK